MWLTKSNWTSFVFNFPFVFASFNLNAPVDSGVAEQGDENVQIETLKKVIKLLLNGERLPGLLMTIIRFVMPSQNHTIKKLLLIFWEIVPKTTPDGKLLQEMILVCDAYRKVSSIEIFNFFFHFSVEKTEVVFF